MLKPGTHGADTAEVTRLGRQTAADVGRHLAVYCLATMAALGVLALAPTAIGWRALVVTSGSMAPALATGDVVLTDAAGDAGLQPGDVAVVRDPARPGGLLTHRVVARKADGELVTKGDANPQVDSGPVPQRLVVGRVRAVVPFLGLLRPALHQPAVLPVGVLGLVLFGLLAHSPPAATTVVQPRRHRL